MNKVKSDERIILELGQNHMNTTFTLCVPVVPRQREACEALLRASHQGLNELENILSEFRTGSDLTRLNEAQAGVWVNVSPHTLFLLKQSEQVARWSRQAFNPSFRSGNLLPLSENFRWEESKERVMKVHPESHLSFGAIGKGYALDLVAQELRDAGYLDFRLIAGGSSMIFQGCENVGLPWRVSLALSKSEDTYQGLDFDCMKTPLHLGVSGSLEQGEHIVRTSSAHLPRVVFLNNQSAALADAVSTAVYANPELLEKYIDAAFILFDNQEQYHNSKFRETFREH